MPFELTPEEVLIRKTVAEFADAHLPGKVAEHVDRAREFPREALTRMSELGLLGMLVPPDLGGAGTDTVSFCLALEEVARRSGVAATLLNSMNALGTYPIATFAQEGVRAEILPALLSGQKVSGWALAEPGAGSDTAAVETRAVRDGTGYTLHGLKSFVMGGGVVDVYLVFARVPKSDGLTAFLVPSDAEGLRFAPPERTLSLRGAHMAQVFFKGVRVPEPMRLGAEGDGLRIVHAALDLARLGAAATAVGFMAAATDEARAYSGQRVQFRTPIKQFQGIQWKIADMDVETRAARLMVLAAAAARDRGEDFSVEGAAAKLFAAEAAKRVTQEAIKIHGGVGFMREMPLERLNRDARAMSVWGGTSEIQRSFLAAKLLDL